ncbi:MAG: cytoplasmic protein [Deltaproteobacteria bacterium]|nr:cytoplasmic protein [Deltaproteobacteria bacterium]
MKEPDYIWAHKYSSNHRKDVLSSKICGCFYCLKIFEPNEVFDWIDESEKGIGQTALCPKCGIDSVIGSNSGFPITSEKKKKMRRYWFAMK